MDDNVLYDLLPPLTEEIFSPILNLVPTSWTKEIVAEEYTVYSDNIVYLCFFWVISMLLWVTLFPRIGSNSYLEILGGVSNETYFVEEEGDDYDSIFTDIIIKDDEHVLILDYHRQLSTSLLRAISNLDLTDAQQLILYKHFETVIDYDQHIDISFGLNEFLHETESLFQTWTNRWELLSIWDIHEFDDERGVSEIIDPLSYKQFFTLISRFSFSHVELTDYFLYVIKYAYKTYGLNDDTPWKYPEHNDFPFKYRLSSRN